MDLKKELIALAAAEVIRHQGKRNPFKNTIEKPLPVRSWLGRNSYVGKQLGTLRVIGFLGMKKEQSYWLAKCVC